MKTIILPTMTDDEIEMLNEFIGQMSDGAGENMPWTTKYWKNMNRFKNENGVSSLDVNDMVNPFKNKTDAIIIKDIGNKFIIIAKDCLDVAGLNVMTKDKDELQAQRIANSIIYKLTGKKDIFEEYDEEEYLKECKRQEDEVTAMVNKCMVGLKNLYNDLADLTGDETLRNEENQRMSVEEFGRELRKLDTNLADDLGY